MPTTRTVFERETREISRAALKLEKLVANSDSIPSPVHYQKILRRLSELHQMWRDHMRNPLIQEADARVFHIEQQLKAVSISPWPRSAQAGMLAIRVSVSGILKLLFQQMTLERASLAAVAPAIHRKRTVGAGFHIRPLAGHRVNPKYLSAANRP